MKRTELIYVAPTIDIHYMPVEEGFALTGGAGDGDYGEYEYDPYDINYNYGDY